MHRPFRVLLVVPLLGLLLPACAAQGPPPVCEGEAGDAADPLAGYEVLEPSMVDGVGGTNNSPEIVIDGRFAKEGSLWKSARCVWWTSLQAHLIVDLGEVREVEGLVIQVASNDDYRIESSTDGRRYETLTRIERRYGPRRWGMQALSSIPGHPAYVPKMCFDPVQARYVKISAFGGDGMYAVAEVRLYGPKR